ncbi:Cys-Cys-COOH (seleno)protein SaoC [Roseburia hominis]
MKKKILLLVVVILAGFLIRGKLDEVYEKKQVTAEPGKVTEYTDGTRVGRELTYAENVPEDNKILQVFKAQYPDAEVLVACEEDLTNDDLKDLVVVYTIEEDDIHEGVTDLGNHRHVRLMVVVDSGDGMNYEFTEPIPAPVENQKIQFQNIDKKDEIEFVLQGQKNNKVGYGIFRVADGKTINLFGEGMEDC